MYKIFKHHGQVCPLKNKKKINKILNIMKISILLILAGVFTISATVYSQDAKISISMHDNSVNEVFTAIKEQTDYSFWYDVKDVDVTQRVSLSAENESVKTVLSQALKEQNVDFTVYGNHIIIAKKGAFNTVTAQQGLTITGKVTDIIGDPLPGVSVSIKGGSHGTATDANGAYTLQVPNENTTLVFSYIGCVTQEVVVGNRTILNVTLLEDTHQIEEVVVVGYGTQRKVSVTGSIATVKNDQLTVSPVASTTNALAGRLPGLIAQQSSGLPGSDAAALSIRGYGVALIIVDGIEMGSFNSIDANQIETITILKDAAASIYGSRAGNGVILVTTKRGVSQKPTVTLGISNTWQGITYFPSMSSSGQFSEMQREAHLNSGKDELTAPFTAEQVQKYYAGNDPQYPNTDWIKEVTKNWAPEQQYNLSVRGGGEKIRYYGYLGYMNQETMFKPNGGYYKRYNLQSNMDAQITDRLILQLDLAAIYDNRLLGYRSVGGVSGPDGDVWQDLWASQPIYPSKLPDPTKIPYAFGAGVGNVRNVIDYKSAGSSTQYNRSMRGTGVLTYLIPGIQGLSAKLFMNYLQTYSGNDTFTRPTQFWSYDYGTDTYQLRGALGSAAQLRVQQSQGRVVTGQLSLHYDRVFANVHEVSAMALYEGIDAYNRWISAGRDDYLSSAIEQLFAGNNATAINNGSADEMGRTSYVGRLKYSYNHKYLIEATLRADASAKFAANKRWGYFPGLSLGWRLSEEGFMKGLSSLDELKLRASYGSSGYDNVGSFQYLSAYSVDMTYVMADASRQGIRSTGMANPNLTWEQVKIYNVGVDWSLFDKKLFGTAEVFYRTRSGIPATRRTTLPSTFGATLPQENLNSLNNRGFELEIGTMGKTGDLQYEISGNVAWARAKWDHYEEPDYTDPDQIYTSKMSGEWVDRRLMYKSNGLFTSQAEIDALPFDQDLQKNATLRPGDIRYVDVNGDGKLDWRDQVKITGTTPLWTTGLNLNLKYKNFYLSSLFQGAFGHTRNVKLYGDYNNQKMYELRWTEKNNDRNALVPRLGGAGTNNIFSDYRLKKASYVRLKVISVGYELPEKWLQNYGFQKARIYLSGYNVFTFNKLSKYGVDPEMPDGYGGYYYPQQRTISLGANLSF